MIISTQVLDLVHGRPAAGVAVALEQRIGDSWRSRGDGVTGSNGRLVDWVPAGDLQVGAYRLVFDTARYFAALGIAGSHPEVVIVLLASDRDRHYDVPLLLGPHAHATYQGSR